MKNLILLFGILLLLPSSFGENEFGKITSGGNLLITDVDVKVDGLTSRNLKYGDDITKIAKPSSVVQFMFKIKNNDTSLNMADIEIVLQVNDLDLEKTAILGSLNSNQDKILPIEITLPSDADKGTYEVFIGAEGILNNTIHKIEYLLDLEVEIPDAEKTSQSITQIEDLKQSIDNLSKEIGSYFEPYAECDSQRDVLEAKISSKDAELATLQEYKARFDSCNTQKEICDREKSSFENGLNLCKQNITGIIIPQYEQKLNNFWLIGFIVVILAGGLYLYLEKKKKPTGEHEVDKGELQ